MYPFEEYLSVCIEDIEFELRCHTHVEWASFVLNPRRLRGSDFLMRWSQGVWSEERVIQAVDDTKQFFAIPYGPSSTAPEDDVREFELYFERLDAAGLGNVKRPDLLIFEQNDKAIVGKLIESIGGVSELPFTPEDDSDVQDLLSRAIIAVECENSLWKGKLMPDYGAELRPQRRLGGKLGLKKTAVLPTIIVKEEDREPLQIWQDEKGVAIHIWHVFYDVAYGLAFSEAQRLIEEGFILPTVQTFQAPGGATTKKYIYKFYYHYGYLLSETTEEPRLIAKHIVDKNGHILPYVHFEGGRMSLSVKALEILREITNG
ncbi:MAG: AccI family restriction endonuclease [Chloroflexota bacterium]